MKWRQLLRDFGIRLAISFVVLGGLYLLIFGMPGHKKPLTNSQKIATVRSNLDQLIIVSHEIATYSGSDTLASTDFASFQYQLKIASDGLQKSISTAPATVTPAMKTDILAIGYRVDEAQKQFYDHLSILKKVLAYDPSTDLGSLDISRDSAKVSLRAEAAANGLSAALNGPLKGATNQNSGVSTIAPLSGDLSTRLTEEIDCMNATSRLIKTSDTTHAREARRTCITKYPALRKAAIADVISSFQGTFDANLKSNAAPLLRRLDQLSSHK
jgi:hypothetical protein